MIKKSAVRVIRKAAHLTHKASSKTAHFTQRVENKATRMITGVDSTFGATTSVSFEKLYYEALPYIVPLHPSLPIRGRKATVTLLLPSLDNRSFFGGTATALIAATLLAEKQGLDLRVVQTLQHGNASLDTFLNRAGIKFSGKIETIDVAGRGFNVYGYIDIHPDDIFMASAWWDAYLLDRLPLKKKYIYLIQDFEPIFYNNSDKYVLAESTYHSDRFVALCNTKLMHDFMVNRGYKNVKGGAWFEPAVSHFNPNRLKEETAGKKKIFVYGRPNVERNLFFHALNSIDHCFTNRYLDINDWELCMAGQDHLPDVELSSGVVVKNLGKMSLEDYKRLVQTVDVAISLMMAPHPNYPTLEFASAGAAVVTTRYDVKQDLSNYSKNIVIADISAESISGAIRVAAEMKYADRLKNASESQIPDSWHRTLSSSLDKTLKSIEDSSVN
jgi:hypothetical protein